MVKRILPVLKLHLPKQFISAPAAPTTIPHTHALQRRDVGNSIGKNDKPHIMTGVDKLRSRGLLGSGIRVAVVDSGVDYKNPALGGCYGTGPPACLISFGYNIADNTPDPYDGCIGHGTFVSGVIAAQTNVCGFTGVAPNVTLGHYKVTDNCKTITINDRVLAALGRATDHDYADIITISYAAPVGWPEEPVGVALQGIASEGIPCIATVLDQGIQGMFYSASGADGEGVIGVGMVNNSETPAILAEASYSSTKGTVRFGWKKNRLDHDFQKRTYELYILSLNPSIGDDGCKPLPSSTPDLSNRIVLIRNGGCDIDNKLSNVLKAHAKNILFYNNHKHTPDLDLTDSDIAELGTAGLGLAGLGIVPSSTAEDWVKLAKEGLSVQLNMVDKNSAPPFILNEVDTVSGGFVNTGLWMGTYK